MKYYIITQIRFWDCVNSSISQMQIKYSYKSQQKTEKALHDCISKFYSMKDKCEILNIEILANGLNVK